MKKIDKISNILIFTPALLWIFMTFIMLFLGQTITFFWLLILCMLLVFISTKVVFNKLNSYVKTINLQSMRLKEANKILKKQFYEDDLTKLFNLKSLDKELKKVKSPKIILMDIDSFKEINEFYGKKSGDLVLLQIAKTIQNFANKYKMKAYRVGADEFALLDTTDLDITKYERIANELVKIFKTKEFYLQDIDTVIVVNTTIGFSFESEDCFAKALKALNFAKTNEKDFACYLHGMDTKDEYEDRLKHIKLIKEALQDDRIIPYFQPIMDKNKKILKYECLSRIKNKDGSIISPAKFMMTSKKARLYSIMTKRIIDKSFEKIAKSDKMLSLNLLPRDMMDSDISNYVIDKLREYKIAKRVVFEILEDESIEHLQRVTNFIDKAKRMGVKIAVDDFGTGYSNFSYLLELKPDYLKIDGSIIKNIDTNRNSQEIVKAIVSFAKSLHVKTIAEFVCSKEVYEKCLKLGIDEFQGYYLGEPKANLV